MQRIRLRILVLLWPCSVMWRLIVGSVRILLVVGLSGGVLVDRCFCKTGFGEVVLGLFFLWSLWLGPADHSEQWSLPHD